MNFTDAANFAVAIATFLLAIVASVTLYFHRRELSVITKQFSLTRAERIPLLMVTGFRFDGDSVVLDVINRSDVPALWVALSTDFYEVKPRYFGDSKAHTPLEDVAARLTARSGSTVYANFSPVSPVESTKLTLNGNAVEASGAITYPKNGYIGTVVRPDESATIEFSPFCFVGRSDGESGKFLDFNEWRSFLVHNGIEYAALRLTLRYKDATEEPVGYEPIVEFVLPAAEHSSLEQCFANKHPLAYTQVSLSQIADRPGFMREDDYVGIRSRWRSLD